MKTSSISLALAALLCFNAHSENLSAPTLNSMVPKTHTVVETIKGDLNKDGQEDMVFLVKATDKAMVVPDHDGKRVDRNRRGLIIAFRVGDSYQIALKNLNCFSSENETGGVYFPPDLSLSIKGGNLLIHYGHGRYGYWAYNFRHQNSEFELIGFDRSENHGPVVESFVSINFLSNKILKKVNTNQEAQGGDERFKESWSKIKKPKTIKLAAIENFDDLSVEQVLGISN